MNPELIKKMQQNSKKVSKVNKNFNEARQFIDNSINTLDQMENELVKKLSFAKMVMETILTAVDQFAISWLDWRSLSWQYKLKLIEKSNK